MENFQNQNGPRLEKGWEPLLYIIGPKLPTYRQVFYKTIFCMLRNLFPHFKTLFCIRKFLDGVFDSIF